MAVVVSSEAIENNSFGFKGNQVCFYITGTMADANDLGASGFRTPCLKRGDASALETVLDAWRRSRRGEPMEEVD